MSFRGGRWQWYDLVFLGLAAVVVYPDHVLDWIGEHTGRLFGWKHLVFLEVVAIALMVVATALLMPMYPRLDWWYPLMAVGAWGLMRCITSFVTNFFGFRD